jgi:hypothetical protein
MRFVVVHGTLMLAACGPRPARSICFPARAIGQHDAHDLRRVEVQVPEP